MSVDVDRHNIVRNGGILALGLSVGDAIALFMAVPAAVFALFLFRSPYRRMS